ncbi:M20 family metallopeptidase [Fusobacterium sp. PH5-44]|uniref:M20 family metallopeptidase n=1 Tax=unclassified Fusobacterium TaxID=2648384 RepID=UPI003D1E7FF5
MKDKLRKIFDKYLKDFKGLNEYIYNNPEMGNREYKACEAHKNLLEKYGFTVETGVTGLDTAFIAKYSTGKPGPKIAFLAEYDALPEIGHGCGHNILGTTSDAAAIIAKEGIGELGGELLVIGTPAEETNGAKVHMAKHKIFDEIDAAMIVHPKGDGHYRSSSSQAMEAIQFTFKGKTAHAASAPHEGINALDGVITMFNAVNALRQQTPSDARIHGVISNGGTAANIIPELAIANFYVRSPKLKDLKILVEKVKNCAKGAALATGTLLEIENYETSFADLVTNQKLSETYEKNLVLQGITDIKTPSSTGSTDTGDVSQCCPAIHPYFPITKEHLTGHSIEMAEATIKEEAYIGMKEAAVAMALTALDIMKDTNLLAEIKKEFEESKK